MSRAPIRSPFRVALRRARVVAAVPLFAATLFGAGAAGNAEQAPVPQAVAEGERLYGMFCASCHGEKAKGNGPTAAVLRKRPTDLTRLARKHDGTFPEADVRAAIDGRGVEHGTRDMPIWGIAFQVPGSDIDQETDVRARIDALVAWLDSIQR